MISIEQRFEYAEKAHAEGRIIQHSWRRNNGGDGGGRELVCALAAFGPDINDPSDCPAELMPSWLAHLVPTLDDGIAATDVQWFFGSLLDRARRWSALNDAAWERVRIGFLKACVRRALESAEALQPMPRPDYWDKVQDACGQVLAALEGNGDLVASRAAAWAAAWAAARAAARAARAAARAAAAWAAAWAVAAAAAAAAEYRKLCEALFALIDSEISL